MFAVVLTIIIVAVIGALWWDARRPPATPGARALAAVAGIAACTWLSYEVMDEARRASLAAPSLWQLALAGGLPALVFGLSMAITQAWRWRGLMWLGYLVPAPAGIVLVLASSDGAGQVVRVIGWCLILWAAGATPSAAWAARGHCYRFAQVLGASPLMLVAIWSIAIFPVTLLTGFTDDFENPPPTISFDVAIAGGGPYAVRIAWPNATLDGSAWHALQAGIAADGAVWEADGDAVWFNGTADAGWHAKLLGYDFYDDASSLVALGPAHISSTADVRVKFSILVRPGGCYESWSGEVQATAVAVTVAPDIEAGCV